MMYLPSLFGEDMEDMMDDFDDEFFGKRNPVFGRHAKNLMKTDIKDQKDHYELDVDLPGCKKEDISLTQRLLEAGRLLEIPIIDHIIVGGGSDRSYSLRTEMPELFFKNGKTFGAKSSISESEAKYASCADMVRTAANIPEREELSGPTRRM